eukprot:54628-Alexandrium_andersonii.AAC.1
MSASLVGSEMCIRDSPPFMPLRPRLAQLLGWPWPLAGAMAESEIAACARAYAERLVDLLKIWQP